MDDDFEMYDEEEYNSKISTSSDVQNENINSYQNSGLESEIYTGVDKNRNFEFENQDYDMVDEKDNIGSQNQIYNQGQNINEFLNQNYINNISTQDSIKDEAQSYNIDQTQSSVSFENQNHNEASIQNSDLLGNQIVNEFLNKNKEAEISALAPMYEEQNSNISYEDALKTATPVVDEIPSYNNNITTSDTYEEKPNEPNRFINNNDFMNYDPMLQNGLETDGDYVISSFDPNQNNDYVPEKTNFDSEGVMESYKNENVEPEIQVQTTQEQVAPEVYNTSGMMQYEENNVDTFNNGVTPELQENTRFIFNDMPNDESLKSISNIEETNTTVGAIPIYDKQESTNSSKEKAASKKALEMVAMVIFVALLILVISFFPDINKFFNNLIK